MKLLLGLAAASLVTTGVAVCPQHVRERAQEAATPSPEVRAEVARQFDLFVNVMRGDGERVDLPSSPSESR
ncbi:hypothetical protein V0U79_09310 [Hyphobacterium sp. HN65]|uniref:Uncharacterized protein n=1 Tax=Hyphobacterium lacteum TaxID=3116575 RepID=A0ABU7LRM7_9PROT|nr:hypothetical protein [Hyphobacterium sp. HN65]MEE2526564.1 hypothetical protein [Hyphobacterium sp. HN65]